MEFKNMKTFKICTTCEIHHIENCETCFGFGLKRIDERDGPIPISASDAVNKNYSDDWIKCPECGATPLGIKNEI